MAIPAEVDELIGLLADKVDNYLALRVLMQDEDLLTAWQVGLKEIRGELRALAIECGADPETWSESDV